MRRRIELGEMARSYAPAPNPNASSASREPVMATIRRGVLVGFFLEDPPPPPRIAINRAMFGVAVKTRRSVGHPRAPKV